MYYQRRNDTIYFGKYYYDVDRKEPIEWDIIDERDGKALIITHYVIDAKTFFKDSNDYSKSSIRKWLNNDFFNNAFSSSERLIIELTKVDNSLESTGQRENPYLCSDTYDKIFLLSYKEATYYYRLQYSRNAKYTPYARHHWIAASCYGTAAWWLRSPVNFYYPTKVCTVGLDGNVYSEFVDTSSVGVRPACWIKL